MKKLFPISLFSAILPLFGLMLCGCSGDEGGNAKKPGIDFLDTEYSNVSAGYYSVPKTLFYDNGDEQDIYLWSYMLQASNSSKGIAIDIEGCPTPTASPNGTYRLYDPSAEFIDFRDGEYFNTCIAVMAAGTLSGAETYVFTGGTLTISRNGDEWTLSIQNGVVRPSDTEGENQNISFTYTGKMITTPF